MNVIFSANRFRRVPDHTLKCVLYAYGVAQGQRRNTCETLRGLKQRQRSKPDIYNFIQAVVCKCDVSTLQQTCSASGLCYLTLQENQIDWDTHLPLFLLAYRRAVHEVTIWTPSEMLFGRMPRLSCDILFGRPTDTSSSQNEYMNSSETRLETVHAFAREQIKLASERMMTRYVSRETNHNFKEGDQICIYDQKRRRSLSLKLQQNWKGHFTIVKKVDDVVHRVQRSPNAKPKVIHINRLAPYRATYHSST
ncbi:hypothetical protein AVEN_26465-1 [Araneus ventricosus]|uniref:Integrase p58-like C-terminal domain-containing protein n=1 Tax=Araneus ventricosus TaxID=182803 RepID=A0A4Y2CVT5_ARAVE|nr:hypothetical protein AVEN_26465-1 [Araneus ventricosus]